MKKLTRAQIAERAKLRRSIKDEWIGSWVKHPRGQKQRDGAQIARRAVRVTPSGGLISPVVVAVIDVLGMTDLLLTRPLEEVARTVAEPFVDIGSYPSSSLMDSVTEKQMYAMGYRRGATTLATFIADSMIVIRRPDWEEGNSEFAASAAIGDMARSVCRTISFNSRRGIWLRAAIAYGDCIISTADRSLMLGLPVREAFYWERRQNWIGGMLAPSAVEAFRSAHLRAVAIHGPDFVGRGANILVRYDVPLKPDPEHPAPLDPCIALNWTSVFGTIFPFGFTCPCLPDTPTSPAVQEKIENTIAFCRKFERDIEPSVLFENGAATAEELKANGPGGKAPFPPGLRPAKHLF